MTQQRQEVLKKDIQSRILSRTSAMPEGLLNTLSQEEIFDLLAYLEASDKPDTNLFGGAK